MTARESEDRAHRDAVVTLTIDAGPFLDALARAAAAAAETLNRFYRDFCMSPDGRIRRVDAHHPKPLPIDGRAYHRRRRARARRGRR